MSVVDMIPEKERLGLSIEPLLTLEEAGAVLRKSPWSVRRYINQEKIRAVTVGRSLMIAPAELRRFIEKS